MIVDKMVYSLGISGTSVRIPLPRFVGLYASSHGPERRFHVNIGKNNNAV